VTILVNSVSSTQVLPSGGNGTPVGPGTLNLATPLLNPHSPTTLSPILVSAMPHTVRWAVGLFAKYAAIQRGAQVVVAPSGKGGGGVMGSASAAEDAAHEAALTLGPYRRIY
jgi:hypothetical protein